MRDPFASAAAIRDAIRRKDLTARDAAEASLARIGAVDARLNAFRVVAREAALARADELDRRDEPAGPLHGVPVALKDNLSTRGIATTAGSKILENYRPIYNATVVDRLEQAGAVIVGKTNCDEFAMGSSTENSGYGPTRNPWDLDRVPGGSSGGSAAAVAGGLVALALGSDTGGSIRQPAALCGIVGLKPTYGAVSRYGLLAFASSLDQIGPFGRTVEDAALLFDAIAGHDPRDATSAPRPHEATAAAAREPAAALRVGVPRHLFEEGVDAPVLAAFEASLETLRSLGATIETVELPHSPLGVAVYYLVATAEASANLARYDGVRYGYRGPATSLEAMYEASRSTGFGAEVKRRIMLGTYVLSAGYRDAYYLKAQQVRTLIRRDFDRAFEKVDVIATPTSPTAAFPIGARVDDPLSMYLADIFTVPAPLAGLPAISVPCGFTPEDLPLGLQFVGRPWADRLLLQAAAAYERATAWHERHPAI
jgi:aspartyl-tRNA(Asn)/glutamyl-tRNA(Gln) amidotransferase subunit A